MSVGIISWLLITIIGLGMEDKNRDIEYLCNTCQDSVKCGSGWKNYEENCKQVPRDMQESVIQILSTSRRLRFNH